MSRFLTVLAATTVLVGLSPGWAAADDGGGDGKPGAPGIGDPYFPLDGNGGYDVEHYDLDLRYDPETDVLTAVATIHAVATQHLSSFNLDFHGLEIHSITVDDDEADWTRDGDELTVTPEDSLKEDSEFTTVVEYDGVPETIADDLGTSGFMHTDDGAIVAGQPDVAATWFPSNDHPRDAASVSVSATVPEGLEALSNGVLEEQGTDDGWTTWSWHAAEPMATYLVTLAIGEFDVREYEADDIRYWDALDPDLFSLDLDPTTEGPSVGEVAEGSFARQPEIIDVLSGIFGRTRSSPPADRRRLRGALLRPGDPDPADLQQGVLHGLGLRRSRRGARAGPPVVRRPAPPARWQHIWLNEGFATYAEWMWLEHEGLATPQEVFDDVAANAPPEFWETTIGDPGADVAALFDIAVYYRGAMTLQALRQTVGDDVFFDIVEEWVSSRAGDTVTTDEFIELAEKESGMQLDDLFEAWLFTPEKPAGLPETVPQEPAP